MAETYQQVLAQYLAIPPQDRIEGSEIDRALRRLERQMLSPLEEGGGRVPGLLMPGEPRRPLRGVQSFVETYGVSFSDDEILDRINSNEAPDNRFHTDKFTLDQNGRGSCAAEGVSGDIMAMRDEMGLPLVKLNPWPLYYLSSGGFDRGSSLQDNIRFAAEVGIPSQDVCPRTMDSFRRMNDTELADARRYRLKEVVEAQNLREAKSLSCMGKFGYMGYSGHAWFMVSCLDLLRGFWKNSWGASWGDNGHGTISWSRVDVYGQYYPIEIHVPNDEVDIPLSKE